MWEGLKMSSDYFRNYEKIYPDLVLDILEYFDITNVEGRTVASKSVVKFCDQDGALKYQPDTINRICKILCEKDYLTNVKTDGGVGLNNNYIFCNRNPGLFSQDRERIRCFFNSMVYGFEYIYNLYKDIVVPLIWETSENDYYLGTGIKYLDGIITAKHCITDAENLQIGGYAAEVLENAKIFIDSNDGVDIAFIHTGVIADHLVYTDHGKVLDEVLVMGYPRIPVFTDFLTAEKATISSKAEARITPTKGSIAAFGDEYLAKIEAMLITARIRGGNSGGPVINENGCLVGIACQVPDYSNNDNDYYDDLGYGIVVPIKYALDIVNKREKELTIPKGFFRDYVT